MSPEIYILIGLNSFILATVITTIYRVGKIEGVLRNGDFLRCPFYRKGCSSGKGSKSN